MIPENVTPEEQLLRLIESGEKGTKEFVFWDVSTWAALFPRKEKFKRPAPFQLATGSAPQELNLKLINRGLVVLLVFSVAGIAWNMNRAQPSLKDLSSQVAAASPLAGEEQPLASLRPLAEYLGEVEKRDLFNPVLPPKPKKPKSKAKPVKRPEVVKPPEGAKPLKRPEVAKPAKPTPLEILEKKAKTLKLVGISWGETPIAMIEDTTKKETSFLKAGEFSNEIQVKTILKDRVVLSHGDAEYDLF